MKRMFKYGALLAAVLLTTGSTVAVLAQGYSLALGPGSSAVSVGQDAYGRTVVSSSGDAQVAVSSDAPIVYQRAGESQIVRTPSSRRAAYSLPPGRPSSVFVGDPFSGVGVAVGPFGGVDVNVGGLGGIFVGVGPEPPRAPLPPLPRPVPLPQPTPELLPNPMPRPIPSLQPEPSVQPTPELRPAPALQPAPAFQPAPEAAVQPDSRDLVRMMQRMEQLEAQLADSQATLAELQSERAPAPEQALPLRTPQPPVQ